MFVTGVINNINDVSVALGFTVSHVGQRARHQDLDLTNTNRTEELIMVLIPTVLFLF